MLNTHDAQKAAIAAVRGFAKNIGLTEDDAVAVYEEELQRLKADARVTRYVDVIAEKRTRDQLRRTARG
jgi:hypothetical protein